MQRKLSPQASLEKGFTGGKVKFSDWLGAEYDARDESGYLEIDVCKLVDWLKKK